MALFGRKLKLPEAANLAIGLRNVAAYVIYMGDTIERRDNQIQKKLEELEKKLDSMKPPTA